MCKIILTLVSATLIAGSTSRMAFSKEHDQRVHITRQCNCERFRNATAETNDFAMPDAASASSSGLGGWASMTGFN